MVIKAGVQTRSKLLQPSKYSRPQTDDTKQFHTDDAQLLGATVQKKNLARSSFSYFALHKIKKKNLDTVYIIFKTLTTHQSGNLKHKAPCLSKISSLRFRHVHILHCVRVESATFGVASDSSRMLIASFVKIDKLFQKLQVRHTEAHRGTQRQTETHRGTQKHTDTHRKTETHRGT